MKKRFILQLLFIGLLVSCSPSLKVSVKNIQDLTSYPAFGFMYSVPRTRLAITVTAIRHQTIPGPYNQYAEKYLGILKSPSLSVNEWELNKVELTPMVEPDPDYYYMVESNQPERVREKVIQFTESGLILQLADNRNFVQSIPDLGEKVEPKHFTDLSIKRNISELSRKTKEKPNKAAVPVDLPVAKQKGVIKSIEQKAEEAADFIIKIRKRRFKLLAGQYTVYPEGMAMETAVRELNALEEEYLSLFIGKVYTDTIQRVFFYTPKPGVELERDVICRFTDETGFEDALSAAGKPMVLESKDLQFTSNLDHLKFPSTGNGNLIYYRLPDKATIRLFFGSIPILESEMEVFQYGSIVPYSINNKGKR